MKKTIVKNRNFVAKHAPKTGAGVHQDKSGIRAKRARQKRAWKKQVKEAI